MRINKKATAGTMESNDVFIVVEPNEGGIEIDLNSPVEKQFGAQIRQTISDVLREMNIENVLVSAADRGALDCTLRARTQTAVARALEEHAK